MSSELIDFDQVCKLLSVGKSTLARSYKRLKGFPPPLTKSGKKMMWDRQVMMKYCDGKTFATLSKQSQSEMPAPGLSFDQRSKAFVSGAFLTTEQKKQLAFKKLVAKTTQPKTRRVRLQFDWMLNDERGGARTRKPKAEAA
jgi:hypothetical protein